MWIKHNCFIKVPDHSTKILSQNIKRDPKKGNPKTQQLILCIGAQFSIEPQFIGTISIQKYEGKCTTKRPIPTSIPIKFFPYTIHICRGKPDQRRKSPIRGRKIMEV